MKASVVILTLSGSLCIAVSILWAAPLFQDRERLSDIQSRRVDLGVRSVPVSGGSVHHRFGLINRSDRHYAVKAVVSSCSCLGAHATVENWPPRSVLEVDAELRLAGFGRRTAVIQIVLCSDEVIVLEMTAIGRPPAPPIVHEHGLVWSSQGVTSATIDAFTFYFQPPDVPIVRTDDGVAAFAETWRLVNEGCAMDGLPWRWRTQMQLTTTDPSQSAMVRIEGIDASRPGVPLRLDVRAARSEHAVGNADRG